MDHLETFSRVQTDHLETFSWYLSLLFFLDLTFLPGSRGREWGLTKKNHGPFPTGTSKV